jgi:integrase
LVLAKGLSPTTARRVYATLHRALECALKWGVVYRNACDAADAPREAHHELDPPDRPIVKRLLERAMNGRHGAAFWLLAYTGMRRGEVCGVRRDDLDFERGVISIAGAVVRDNGSLEFVRPKSATSRRSIHIGVKTIAVLNTHLAQQAQERLVLGAAYHDEGFVFAPPTGGLLDPDVLTKTWQQICTDEEVTHTLRSLRHHHATALIEAGVHIKSVQARLGHSSPSLTMAVYSHVTPGMDEAAAEAYARAMSA